MELKKIHSSSVVLDDNGVLILGSSGSGKSDLALRLIDAGATLVSDDISICKKKSNDVLRFISKETRGEIVLIGTGGIENARDAYEKIKIGASLVQLYSSLTFNNLGFINQINKDLSSYLRKDGFTNIKEAIGIEIR